ncbi:MAG: HNH endonuclease [Niameybacter sp.]
MSREFAKKFYRSKAWLKCREAVYKRDFGLCVRCGGAGEEVHHMEYITPDNINDPSVTLNPNNLITLCKDCHHREHERNQFTKHDEVAEGLMFDKEGNMIQA